MSAHRDINLTYMEKVVVAVRVRPPNEREILTNDKCMWSINSPEQNTISVAASTLCDLVEEGTLSPASNVQCTFGTIALCIVLR